MRGWPGVEAKRSQYVPSLCGSFECCFNHWLKLCLKFLVRFGSLVIMALGFHSLRLGASRARSRAYFAVTFPASQGKEAEEEPNTVAAPEARLETYIGQRVVYTLCIYLLVASVWFIGVSWWLTA